jgi:drug/metabolite transporter (DMT)-like permease
MAALLALVSSISFGISDFTGGLASRRATAVSVVSVSNGLSLLVALAVATLLPGSTLVGADMAWGAGAGAIGLAGVVLLYRGLAVGPMSVVAPITAVLAAAIPLLVGTARGERPGALAVAGVVLALPAIVLISREPGRDASGGGHQAITPLALVAALVAVLSSLYPATTVLLARTLLRERLGGLQVAGLGMAAGAVVLIAAR